MAFDMAPIRYPNAGKLSATNLKPSQIGNRADLPRRLLQHQTACVNPQILVISRADGHELSTRATATEG